MPESTQPLQVEPAAQQPGCVGGKPLEPVGHRGQVGRLVVTDRCPLAEPLLVRASLGTKGPGLRVGVHRDDPAVGEHCHRRIVGVVHAHHDIAMTGELFGDGRQQQRREPAGRQHQDRIAGLLPSHGRVRHGVAQQPDCVQSEELATRHPRLWQVDGTPGVWVRCGRIPGPDDQLSTILGLEE